MRPHPKTALTLTEPLCVVAILLALYLPGSRRLPADASGH